MLVRKWEKTAAGAFLYRHFRHNRHTKTRRNHAQNATELAALEDDPWIHASPVAGSHGGFAETMAVSKRQKWIRLEVAE